MYQPDGIASYTVGGSTYLVTANEGDSRSWAGFTEDVRVSALPHPLNPNIFTDTACGGSCTSNARLGRLTATSTMGLNPETNQYDALYAFGGRSFSIWMRTAIRVGLWSGIRAAYHVTVDGELQRR